MLKEGVLEVPLTRPSIRESDIDLVVKVIRSGQLVQGQYVQKLESLISKLVGVKETVAVTSGTATLHLALLAEGIGSGDEVIVPAFSYVATANVVELVGAKPVFVDVELESLNIESNSLEAVLSDRVKAIMPVHEFGLPADMEKILCVAEKHNLVVIEDAACALGAEWKGQKVGGIGKVGSFSLHPRKSITSGEGGLLTTNDQAMADYYRIMRNHGISTHSGSIEFARAGYNYRMTDLQAALVLGQLERLDEIQQGREHVVRRYNNELINGCFQKPRNTKQGKSSWQSYHIVLDKDVDRKRFFEHLAGYNIGFSYGAQCIPSQKYYREKYQYESFQFPNAERAFKQGVVLPLFDTMTEDQVSYVVEKVNLYFKGNVC